MVKKLTAIQEKVENYYSDKILQYGATPAGVDWNSPESQQLRFEQLVKVCDGSTKFSINDYGCGYGAMCDYLSRQDFQFQYTGYDLSEPMINEARRLNENKDNCEFIIGDLLKEADYTVASGVFNVKMDVDPKEWEEYVLGVLDKFNQNSGKGFSFNALTSYSDKEYMKEKLYYPDPCFYLDYCKRNFSAYVALLHDYPLYEFSVIVRKDI